MKSELMNEIENELRAEKMLFEDRMEYSDEEKEQINAVIDKRLNADYNYKYLIYGYFSKLVAIYGENYFYNQDDAMKMIPYFARGEKNLRSYKDLEEIVDWDSFVLKECYGYMEDGSYANMMKDRVMDIATVKQVLENPNSFDLFTYKNNINFVITNNVLLRRYPEFYSAETLKQLKEIASIKGQFKHLEEYKHFKKATKVTLKMIKKEEEKKSNKVKCKNLFKKD